MSYYSIPSSATLKKSRDSKDPGITFDLPLDKSGPSQLPTNMTINGVEVEPIFRYSSSGVRENLYGYTEDFSNGVWVKYQGLTVNSNSTLDPLGGMTADAFVLDSAGSNTEVYLQQQFTAFVGEIYTWSVYLKSAATDWVALKIEQTGYPLTYFNLKDGTVGSTIGTGIVGSRIENVDNGWYRCSVTFIANASFPKCRVQLTRSESAYIIRNGAKCTYAWGAQLNSGPLLPYYNAGAASAGPNRKWFADVGPDLDYISAGTSTDILIKHGPFTDGTPVVKFNGGGYFKSSIGTPGPGVVDWAVETVGLADWSTGLIFEWPNTTFATSPRLECYVGGTQINAVLSSASPSGTATPGSVRNSGTNNWRHQIDFFDNSQLNATTGLQSRSNSDADSRTSTSTITNANLNMSTGQFTIGARVNGGEPLVSGTLAYISIHALSDWYPGGAANTTAFQATIKERSAQVMGIYPAIASGSATPLTATRSTNNSFLDIEDESGYRSLHQVAKGWMRVCQRRDGYGDLVSGYLSEESATQQLADTDDIVNSGYSHPTVSRQDGYEVFAPYPDAQVCTYISTGGTAAEHSVYWVNELFSGDYWVSVWAKKGTMWNWIALRGPTNEAGNQTIQFFNLSNGTLGSYLNEPPLDAFIEHWGNGWYKCSLKIKNGKTGYLYLHATDTDGDISIDSTAGSQLLHIVFPQAENGTKTPTSHIINTGTGTVTRSQDQLTFGGALNSDNQGQIKLSIGVLTSSTQDLSSTLFQGATTATKFDISSIAGSNFYTGGYDDNVVLAWNHNTSTKNWYDGFYHTLSLRGISGDYKSYFDNEFDIQTFRDYDPSSTMDYIHIGLNRNLSNHPNALINKAKIYSGVNYVPRKISSNDPGLTFDLPLNQSGPSQLPKNMVVNNIEVEPMFRYSSSGVRENLYGYTEDFSNGVWLKSDLTIQSNIGIAPDGTFTADGILASSAGGNGNINIKHFSSAHQGEIYTVSVYAKAKAKKWLFLSAEQATSPYPSYPVVYFDIENGTIGTQSNNIGAQIIDVGNGWFRCSMSFVVGYAGGYIKIAATNSNGNLYPPRDGSIYCLIWGAQLNSGPLLPYYNAGASSAGPNRKWFADVGPDLDYSGSGSDILIKHGPFTDSAPIIKFKGGKHFVSAASGIAGPRKKDVAIEYLGFNDSSGGTILMEWGDTAAQNPRIELNTTRSTYGMIRGTISSGGGSASTYGCRGSGIDNLYHFIEFYDNSALTSVTTGLVQYANACADQYSLAAAANDIDIDMTSSSKISIGARINGTTADDTGVCLVSVYSRSNWFPGVASNTSVFQATTKERSARAMGVYPRYAAGEYLPSLHYNNNNGKTLYMEDESGIITIHRCAKGWLRVQKRKDNNGKYLSGLYSEGLNYQKLKENDNLSGILSSSWFDTNCIAVDGYEVFHPFIDVAVWSIIPDSSNNVEHVIGQLSVASTGSTGWMFCWAKAGVLNWLALRCQPTSSTAIQYFDLQNGVLGSQVGTQVADAFIQHWGNGWYLCAMKYQNGTTGTASIYACEGNSDSLYAASDLTAPLIHVVLPHVDTTDHLHNVIINPATSTTSTGRDNLQFNPIGNYDGGATGDFTLSSKILKYTPSFGLGVFGLNESGGNYGHRAYTSSNGGPLVYRNERQSDNALIFATETSLNVQDGYIHALKFTWDNGNQSLYINQTQDISQTANYNARSDISYLVVGADRPNNENYQWSGQLSEFKLYRSSKNEP